MVTIPLWVIYLSNFGWLTIIGIIAVYALIDKIRLQRELSKYKIAYNNIADEPNQSKTSNNTITDKGDIVQDPNDTKAQNSNHGKTNDTTQHGSIIGGNDTKCK
jgi:hypothetical protein